ncbi:MAG: thioredoxin family protein [Chloroflexota bacterium]
MVIKILGSGCANCKRVEALAREVVGELGVPVEIEKVTDYKEIMSYGILATPGLVVDGEVKSAGRIPNKAELTSWMTSALARTK